MNTAKSVDFCLPILQGGGSSKSGKSLKGVSKKSIFASPESIQGKVSCGFLEDYRSSTFCFWGYYGKTRWKNNEKFDDMILFRIATFNKANGKKRNNVLFSRNRSKQVAQRKENPESFVLHHCVVAILFNCLQKISDQILLEVFDR